MPTLTADIWVVIISSSAVIYLLARRISEQFGLSLAITLAAGGYLANVVARLADIIPPTTHITTNVLADSVVATFAGMGIAFALWASVKVALAALDETLGMKRMRSLKKAQAANQAPPSNRNLKPSSARSG